LAAFDDPGRVHLIAGGYDKGIDLQPIIELAPRLAGFYTIGATGDKLAGTASDRAVSCDVLETAVRQAMARMESRDVLLLSPGCASWDQFDNYEQRGELFCRLVREVLSEAELIQHREH
jgi:UDP-N-acetylmuramoylalanine--D-glutamate ligase